MRRILSLVATCVLGAGMAIAQGTTPSAPPAQDTNTAATQKDQPTRSADRPAAKPSDTTAGADQNAAAATGRDEKQASNPSKDAAAASDQGQPTRPESPDAANQDPARRASNGSVPWLWIGVGVVALIVLFSLFGGRREPVDRVDRVTTIDRTREFNRRESDRDRDDIRRAG